MSSAVAADETLAQAQEHTAKRLRVIEELLDTEREYVMVCTRTHKHTHTLSALKHKNTSAKNALPNANLSWYVH